MSVSVAYTFLTPGFSQPSNVCVFFTPRMKYLIFKFLNFYYLSFCFSNLMFHYYTHCFILLLDFEFLSCSHLR